MSNGTMGCGCEQASEMLTLHPFGLLGPDEARLLEEHIDECDHCREELASFSETAADLPYSLPDLSPPPKIREIVLASISPKKKMPIEQPLPGVFVRRKGDQQWKNAPYPGVTFKTLYVDPVTKSVTSLLKLVPGALYPAHRHAAVEQCLVLEGTVRIGQIVLHAGDFEYANAGTQHSTIHSDSGCLLLIMSNQLDEVFV